MEVTIGVSPGLFVLVIIVVVLAGLCYEGVHKNKMEAHHEIKRLHRLLAYGADTDEYRKLRSENEGLQKQIMDVMASRHEMRLKSKES